MTEMVNPGDLADANRRQLLYWRLLGRLFDPEEQPGLEKASMGVVDDLGLPAALLDPAVSVETVIQRFPDLADELRGLLTAAEITGHDGPFTPGEAEVRRAALVSKLLLNVFGTGSGPVDAGRLARWQSDAGWFEQALGHEPGELRGQGSGLGATLAALEGDLVSRMHLREVLADPATRDDGNAILGHVFGSKEVSRQVAARASAKTGIDSSILKQMLPLVAAMAMGGLSKKEQAQLVAMLERCVSTLPSTIQK